MGRSRIPAHIRALLPQEAATGPKRQRPSHWPTGVNSDLEMMLLTRLEHAGLPLGETQYPAVVGRQFKFDRAWPAPHMVAVEVQGGLWVAGAHSRGSGVERDCLKLSMAAAVGWRVLPISKAMIESGEAIALIRQALGLETDR